MNVIQASAYSPISSTQKNRIEGRSKIAEIQVIDVAQEHAGQHVDHGDQHQRGDDDVGQPRDHAARGPFTARGS